MNIDIESVLKVLAVVGGVLGVVSFIERRYARKDVTDLKESFTDTCSDLKDRVHSLEIKVQPIWNVIEQEALKGLRSNPNPDHVERDAMIDKYLAGHRLTREEARSLVRDFMEINEGKQEGNKGLAVLGIAVLVAKYSDDVEDMLKG